MRILFLALLCLHSAQAYLYCYTRKGTKFKSKVPTHSATTIITTNVHTTHTPTTITEPLGTYVTIIGKTTTTLPTAPGFYPVTDSPTITSPWPSFYPESVDCTTFKTIFVGPPSTTTVPNLHFTYPATILTSYVKTSTAYAACATDPSRKRPFVGPNIVARFHGELISEVIGDYVFSPNPDDPILRTVGLDAVRCCEYAQSQANFTGWFWRDSVGSRECFGFRGAWNFTTYEYYPGDGKLRGVKVRYGNGPRAGGRFVRVVPGAN